MSKYTGDSVRLDALKAQQQDRLGRYAARDKRRKDWKALWIMLSVIVLLILSEKSRGAEEWVLTIFTVLPPHVEASEQEGVVPDCPTLVAILTPTFEAAEGLFYTLECEKRSKKK